MISEAALLGVVLFLVFGAACYYLYMRIEQTEKKVSVMENILLDLKVATENTLLSSHDYEDDYTHTPSASSKQEHSTTYESFRDTTGLQSEKTEVQANNNEEFLPFEPSPKSVSGTTHAAQTPKLSVNYESMTWKELLVIGRGRVVGYSHMSKAQLVDALKRIDEGTLAPKGGLKQEETIPLTSYTSSSSDKNDTFQEVQDLPAFGELNNADSFPSDETIDQSMVE